MGSKKLLALCGFVSSEDGTSLVLSDDSDAAILAMVGGKVQAALAAFTAQHEASLSRLSGGASRA